MSDVVSLFQSFRTVLCVCPHCGDLGSLSDLRLRYRGAAPRTWLDSYESDENRLERLEFDFEQKREAIHRAAIQRAASRVPKMVNKCIHDSIACLGFNPYDIKALYHPVDLIVFNGLKNGERVEDVDFV
jgi:predicted Holliday junction resolvase-like endonuclease